MVHQLGYLTISSYSYAISENHRTDIAYENSFIIKNFAFQFVNSYVSLFYVAFVKGNIFMKDDTYA